MIKQKRPVQSFGASDLDTSSLILDSTSLDAPFFGQSSIPFLPSLWKKTDAGSNASSNISSNASSNAPIKPITFSPVQPIINRSLDPQPFSLPENRWVDRREASSVPVSDAAPERFPAPIYPEYRPTTFVQPHYNDYYQKFGNYAPSSNFN